MLTEERTIENTVGGLKYIIKSGFDRFRREVKIEIYNDKIHLVSLNGSHIFPELYSYDAQNRILRIFSTFFTGQPKWWQFWRKPVDPTVTIPI